MSASGKPQWQTLFEPKVPGFPKVPLNDIAAVEQAIGPATVAVMVEPIQDEAGVIPANDTFLRELRCLTRERNVLLIVDARMRILMWCAIFTPQPIQCMLCATT